MWLTSVRHMPHTLHTPSPTWDVIVFARCMRSSGDFSQEIREPVLLLFISGGGHRHSDDTAKAVVSAQLFRRSGGSYLSGIGDPVH